MGGWRFTNKSQEGSSVSEFAPYNPLDRKNLGASVAVALLERQTKSLGSLEIFQGAGIYSIYYTGEFSAYAPIATRNIGGKFETPIYVGKAVPQGARKGGIGLDSSAKKALYNRLSEHAESINATTNLSIEDFFCRFLVVDDIWIPLGESLLIAKFAPVWNTIIDGFGNHDPGKGRYKGMRPRWDVLHPGREWARKCKTRPETADQIIAEVEEYLRSTPIPPTPHFYAEQARAKYKSGQ